MIKKDQLAEELRRTYEDEDLIPDTIDEAFEEGVLAACDYFKKLMSTL